MIPLSDQHILSPITNLFKGRYFCLRLRKNTKQSIVIVNSSKIEWNTPFLKDYSFNSFALMTLEKLVILKVVRTGAMNLALQPSARCINI